MFKRFAVLALVSLSVAAGARPAAPAKVEGAWNIVLQLGEIAGRPMIELKQDGEKLTGTYRGRYGASPLEGEIKENQIAFAVTMNAEGQQTTGYFAGVVDGDRMNGTVEFEGAGEGTWSATRAPKK